MVLVYGEKRINALEQQMNEDLTAIEEWSTQNGLGMNEDKTVYMKFNHKNKKDISINIKLKTSIIKIIKEMKYVGI